jgi:hypothetical protein
MGAINQVASEMSGRLRPLKWSDVCEFELGCDFIFQRDRLASPVRIESAAVGSNDSEWRSMELDRLISHEQRYSIGKMNGCCR